MSHIKILYISTSWDVEMSGCKHPARHPEIPSCHEMNDFQQCKKEFDFEFIKFLKYCIANKKFSKCV